LFQKIERCIGKKLEEPWFKTFTVYWQKNENSHGSKQLTVYWQKIRTVMAQKILTRIGKKFESQ